MNLIDVVPIILANASVCPTCGPFDTHLGQLKPLPPLWDSELSRYGKAAGIAEDDREFGKK